METSVYLLEQLKEPSNAAAWNRFVALYVPLLVTWARRAGVPEDELADLVQDVLVTLVQKLPGFRYDPNGSFRGWLRTITVNRWRDLCRRKHFPEIGVEAVEIADLNGSADFWNEEYEHEVVAQALKLARPKFQERTWRAFWEVTVEGRAAGDVARDLGLTPGAVYIAKCRVLKHLRAETAGLFD